MLNFDDSIDDEHIVNACTYFPFYIAGDGVFVCGDGGGGDGDDEQHQHSVPFQNKRYRFSYYFNTKAFNRTRLSDKL